ncbi:SapC family protein [Desulfobacula toluolica]|uniref:SapC family protein n=1 Tax=Desulfobacula toluolica (strain DSM 7467 / Tol2) TaxID=651182 RepID=K0NES0_DESTT|nr:SapC family protein [Desulfobacula toluolica]CCK79581.1 SapC family protein [Desulfobacula toluolica Tol2]
MFKQLIPLNAETHRDLLFSPNQSFDFAREQVMLPLVASELNKVAREMAIVFPLEGGVPQALVGVDAGHNLYINQSGYWLGRYIPAQLRRYPFALTEVDATSEQLAEHGRRFALQVDIASAHLNQTGGQRLFEENGHPTKLLKKVQRILMHIRADNERTVAMVAELESLDLLVPQYLKINPDSGNPRVISGFRLVDTQAFAKLTPDQLGGLHTSGSLALIYAHFISLSNLEDGCLAKQAANRGTQTVEKDEIDLEKIFGSFNDTLKFDF